MLVEPTMMTYLPSVEVDITFTKPGDVPSGHRPRAGSPGDGPRTSIPAEVGMNSLRPSGLHAAGPEYVEDLLVGSSCSANGESSC